MTSTNKRTAQFAARPSARNSRSASKVLPGTAAEPNRRVPLDDWPQKTEPKPWKQASRSYPRFLAGKVVTRRNAGRDDGRTWMSGRYVCGMGLEEGLSDEGGGAWDGEDERRGEVFVEGEEHRTEVAIMEIAKPMKLRGPAREYEVVGTIPRVITLEDDDEWEWIADGGLEREDDHWETIGETISSRDSYAKVLQRQVA
ncbi:hypothetical protein GSI_08861 [Ganoderma sinense ZZ0214-1]|uniref:Uncharacterized protein n=1 Tax=Ganoderma sinense ZZ0214-1 TaxID=1077348 RepID=A0A2G8S4W3_9APHY|nr:hypothetical protein GSI_08861 [Ganoderma sinense ZZ0214-1]